MYVWLRLFKTLIKTKSAPPLRPPEDISAITMRVWPHDLDLNLHVNNGRYLTLMDIGRMDLLFRSGLGQHMRQKKWQPVLTGLNARYRRPLGLFQRFRMETAVVGWTEQSLFMEHRIIPLSGRSKGEIAVTAVVRAVMLEPGAKSRKVRTADLFAPLGPLPESPPLPETCTVLLSAEEQNKLAEKHEKPMAEAIAVNAQ